jgi:symplekin
LFPLLPPLLALPPPRLSVAITKLLEAMPPQVVAPIDLLVALHHVDLRSEPAMQKKVIQAINLCVEHRHAFPSDVLLHVCRVLVQDEKISKLALRTLILSVTAYPNLQQDMTALLEILVERHVWEMEDALWKGFVKCAALIQPASFPLLLHKLPVAQLRVVLDDEPDLRALLCEFVKEEGGTGAAANLSAELRECIGLQHDATGGPDDAMNANVAEADEPSKQEEGDDVQN